MRWQAASPSAISSWKEEDCVTSWKEEDYVSSPKQSRPDASNHKLQPNVHSPENGAKAEEAITWKCSDFREQSKAEEAELQASAIAVRIVHLLHRLLPSQSSSMTRVESEVHEDQVTGASSLQCMPCAQEIDRINGIIVKGSPLVGKPHSSATYLDHQREALNLALENRAQEAVHIK